jgi:hypothetical protein
LRAVLVGKLHNSLSGRRVAVSNDDMGVRVVSVLSRIVDRRQPRHAVGGQAADENPNQGLPPRRVQFQRQGHHDLVDDPRILPVGPLGFIEPSAGLRGSRRHVLADHGAGGAAAGDVSRVRARRPRAVRAAPDGAMAQAENRHAPAYRAKLAKS